jgi:hypothetical protein
MSDITTASPVEVDTEIFAQLQAMWAAEDRQARLTETAHQQAGDRKEYGWGRGQRKGTWQMSDEQAWEKVAKIAQRDGAADYTVHNAEELVTALTETIAEIKVAFARQGELEAEYERRGRWTRAYLVDQPTGHVHKTTYCPSWNRGESNTRYAWLTELSGHAETEIVELAGERACTICYPSAPVDVLKRPSKLEGPAQAAAREAAEARRAEKAARDAKKAAKAIAQVDGSPLRDQFGIIATERSAWVRLVDNIFSARAYGYAPETTVNNNIVAALAAKSGTTAEDILAQAETKVAAKAKREGVVL